MKLERIPWPGSTPPSQADLHRALEADGFSVFAWTDGPSAHYDPHRHEHDESIWCVGGEITFGVGGGEVRLGPGDRLMLPKGTTHTADAGPAGATYLVGQREN